MGFCCNSFAAAKTATERIVAVMPDASIALESSGKAVFQNILFPDVKQAQDWLTKYALQQTITIDAGESNRYGDMQIISPLQEKMLRDGVAVIYAQGDTIPSNWRVAESSARTAKTGMWAMQGLLLTSENAAQHIGEFHVIEGKLKRIYSVKAGTYLNFGEDWHTDFSITIPPKLRRSMKVQLETLKEGAIVRVRGGIIKENGPMIVLTNENNLEIE